jgi:hypothetical protein
VTEQSQPAGQPPRTASEILSAAETLAEEIRERAHADADAIRARASSESDVTRAALSDRVQRLSALADGMREQLGKMQAELDQLGGSLEGPPGGAAPAPVRDDPGVAAEPDAPVVIIPEPGHVRPVAVTQEPAAAAPAASQAGVDDAGARLIALNLALSDTPRDEAARQLRDQVPDPERLVDEVYASVDPPDPGRSP